MQLGCASTLDVRRGASSRTKLLAGLAIAGVGGYVAIDVLLAFLRPSYSLVHNAESDYGRGAWYWVMDLNFLLRCAFSVALAVALSGVIRLDGRVRAGLALLVMWAACSGLLAFFADDLEGQRQHGSGVVHLALAFVAFTAVAVGAVVLSTALAADTWGAVAPVLRAIAIAGVVAYLLLGGALRRHHAPVGVDERVFLGLELAWIAVAAVAAIRGPRRESAQLARPGREPRSYPAL